MGNLLFQRQTLDEMVDDIVQEFQKSLQAEYPNRKDTKRDAHPKNLGLLQAEFKILKDIPAELKVGLFATGTSYPCWIRFSNASGKVQSDLKADIRGCALKLISKEKDSKTVQDFVLINTPNLPLGTPDMFRDAVYYGKYPLVLVLRFLLKGKMGNLLRVLFGPRVIDSLLGESYHSTTPYTLGDKMIVKYGLFPTSYTGPALSKKEGFNYLTNELQKRLSTEEANFDFCVQLRTDEKIMVLDDADVLWDSKISPFIKVASVRIPAQQFTTPERAELSEAIAFNVDHAAPEHKPLGSLNYVRIGIYNAMSKFRHERASRPGLYEFVPPKKQ